MTDAERSQILEQRLDMVRERIAAACARSGRRAEDVTLIAVSKTVSPRVAGLSAKLGQLDLGESRPQELWRKAEALKALPIRWHMIGHLQRNKVERTLASVQVIHSVDSLRLLEEIAEQGSRQSLRPRLLLQVNASRENQKYGFELDEVADLFPKVQSLPVEITGLMTMAALSSDPDVARTAFRALRQIFDDANREGAQLTQLSMGMSGDFEIAIEEGATMVRVGSTLFEGLEAE